MKISRIKLLSEKHDYRNDEQTNQPNNNLTYYMEKTPSVGTVFTSAGQDILHPL
jgi:hypothetical protein